VNFIDIMQHDIDKIHIDFFSLDIKSVGVCGSDASISEFQFRSDYADIDTILTKYCDIDTMSVF